MKDRMFKNNCKTERVKIFIYDIVKEKRTIILEELKKQIMKNHNISDNTFYKALHLLQSLDVLIIRKLLGDARKRVVFIKEE